MLLSAPTLLPGAAATGFTCNDPNPEAPGAGSGTLTPGRPRAYHRVVAELPQNVLVVQPGTRLESLPGFDPAANVDMRVYDDAACRHEVCASTNPAPFADVCIVPPGTYISVINYVSSTAGYADWFIAYVHGAPALV